MKSCLSFLCLAYNDGVAHPAAHGDALLCIDVDSVLLLDLRHVEWFAGEGPLDLLEPLLSPDLHVIYHPHYVHIDPLACPWALGLPP